MRKRFESAGTVVDLPRSGRPRTVSTEENLTEIAQTFVENPNQSPVKVSKQFVISRTSLRRLIKALKLKVYQPHLLQELNEDDFDHRTQFCKRFIIQVEANPTFAGAIIWSDEATFKLNGSVNRHNCMYYDSKNPNIVLTEELNAPGVCVWAGISSYTIIGPYFFDSTVTGPVYLEMLREVKIELKNTPIFQGRRIIWQQDGAPCHFAVDVGNFLNENFLEWIGCRGKTDWPPQSPDLTPRDFSLWGVIKDRVFRTKSRTINELKDRIAAEFEILAADAEYLKKACAAVKSRCLACIEAEGKHFEHLLK